MTTTEALSDVVSGFRRIPVRPPVPLWICDSGRPLWPVRWDWYRDAAYSYRITAIAADGTEVELFHGPVAPWPVPLPLKRIDLSEYRRRQLARAKRRRR